MDPLIIVGEFNRSQAIPDFAEPLRNVIWDPLELDRKEWLLGRRSYIGASDVHAAMGLSGYDGRVKLWKEKTGASPIDESCSPQAEFGNWVEPYLLKKAAWYCQSDNVGAMVYQVPYRASRAGQPGYRVATLDGLCIDWRMERFFPIECKAGSSFDWDDWMDVRAGLVPDLNSKVGGYYLQIQTQMDITGADRGLFVVLLHNKPRFWMVYRNQDIIERIREECGQFWQYVETGQEPPASELDEFCPTDDAKESVELDIPEIWEWVDVHNQKRILEKRESALKKLIEQKSTGALSIDFPVAKGLWVTVKPQTDRKAMEEAHPELARNYIKPGYTFFKITPKKMKRKK